LATPGFHRHRRYRLNSKLPIRYGRDRFRHREYSGDDARIWHLIELCPTSSTNFTRWSWNRRGRRYADFLLPGSMPRYWSAQWTVRGFRTLYRPNMLGGRAKYVAAARPAAPRTSSSSCSGRRRAAPRKCFAAFTDLIVEHWVHAELVRGRAIEVEPAYSGRAMRCAPAPRDHLVENRARKRCRRSDRPSRPVPSSCGVQSRVPRGRRGKRTVTALSS